MSEQNPSVGRVVHYSEDGQTCLAATVAAVNEDGTVNLGYLSRNGGNRQVQNVASEVDVPAAGQWHWPERV
jgi:hypothetical protein